MNMKRRDFITSVAASGGSAYAAMVALGLMEQPAAARPTKFQLSKNARGTRVIILGAGLAGMASAYELNKAGYQCTLLEARPRAGGRCWTLRGGDQVTDTDGVTQTASFAKGQYFNPGPARIPQHHVTLDYCRELGVPLEAFTNLNRQAYFYNENAGPLSSQKVRARSATFDMYGYISELLAKAVNQSALDDTLSAEDKERLVSFLRSWGALNSNLQYTGSSRRGYDVQAQGAGTASGQFAPPYDLTSLLQLGFSPAGDFGYDQQMMMFQPVGGMDQIARAFERQVGKQIRFESKVEEIRKTTEGVRVVYRDRTGVERQIVGDYCICTIPLPVLATIPSDFSPQMQEAIASVAYAVTGKIGLQFSRRFWEEDEDLYGGITNTNQQITQIWYPSYGYGGRKGVIVGYYNFGNIAASVGNLTPADRQALALAQGGKIHSQYTTHFETAVSIYWSKIPYNLGGWASYTTSVREQYYPTLNQPDGNIYLAGEHLSYLTGWMAGALESARLVTSNINQRSA